MISSWARFGERLFSEPAKIHDYRQLDASTLPSRMRICEHVKMLQCIRTDKTRRCAKSDHSTVLSASLQNTNELSWCRKCDIATGKSTKIPLCLAMKITQDQSNTSVIAIATWPTHPRRSSSPPLCRKRCFSKSYCPEAFDPVLGLLRAEGSARFNILGIDKCAAVSAYSAR